MIHFRITSFIFEIRWCWKGQKNLANNIISFSTGPISNGSKWVCSSPGNYNISVTESVYPTSWHHLVLVKNSVGVFFYINGALRGSYLQSFVANFGSNPRLKFGFQNTLNGSPSSFFGGKIDDVQIYKGALTAGQVQALYNNTNSCFDATTYTCLSNMTYNSILNGQQTLQVSNQIIGSSIIQTGSNIHFDSKNSVILQPGFKTETNAVFRASAGGGCN